jgi:hypothetical protein
MPVNICDTIVALVYPEIEVTVTPNPATFCEDSIGTLVSTITPTGTYGTNWYSGPNGTGSVVSTTSNYTPTASGTYSVVVVDQTNNFVCNSDTENVVVNIVPLPQFELGPDTTLCLTQSVTIDLPNGPVYTWTPNTGVTPGGDPSIFVIAPTDTVSYSVTATTAEGCKWIDTWTVNVLSCQLICPAQYWCSTTDIISYNTVTDFESNGGVVSLPCLIQDNSIALINTSTNGLSCPETIIHTYEITDNCGNSAYCDVILTINDTIPPVWDNGPSPIGPLN